MTDKGDEAFRSIGEVARLVGVAPHVLRYWETQFPQLRPMKRPDGRRYYRPDDLRLAAGLCEVLRDDGLTIRGARKLIAADKGAALRARGAARLKPGRTGPEDATPTAVALPLFVTDPAGHDRAAEPAVRSQPQISPASEPQVSAPQGPDVAASQWAADAASAYGHGAWLGRLFALRRFLAAQSGPDSAGPGDTPALS